MQPTVETLRRELAAAFRLAAKHEFNEGVCNHFSVELPTEPEALASTRCRAARSAT